jgi:hypothetical protein
MEEPTMQLDIFEHSSDVMLRNDVIHALLQRDAAAGRAACDRLAQQCPAEESLSALRALAERLEDTDRRPFSDHAALGHARQAVEALMPLAERVFGPLAAAKWLAPLWEDLALRAEALPFRADSAQDHAVPHWLRAGHWSAAAQAVGAIESWRRIPAPLAWMTEARLRMLGLLATWPLIAELGWLSPGRLDKLLRQSPDPALSTLVRKFGATFEGDGSADDAAWFAAWVLTERPDIAEHVAGAQPSQHTAPERALRTLVELLRLERQGRQRDIVERRKQLRDLHPALYQAYMKNR